MQAQLAPHQIKRLNTVGAFIELRDARIAHQLLHAMLGNIAVSAMHLNRQIGAFEAAVGQESLDDRRHQLHQLIGVAARLGVRVVG